MPGLPMTPSRSLSSLRVAAYAVLAMLALSACRSGSEQVLSEFACHAGAWRDARGDVFVLTSTTGGAMRYRLPDGRTGLFHPEAPDVDTGALEGWRQDGPAVAHARFGACDGNVAFAMGDETPQAARRMALVSEDIRFDSDGLSLRGRLVLPEQADGPVPLAVLVHGSEDYSALDIQPLQYLLPAQGVAVFVYDKRGTGGSEGAYTQDFDLLAADAIAAMDAARRMRPEAFSRVGYVGGSQGGWVAPLAASRSRADYAVALFGLAESPLAEDREQVANDLRAKGHGEDIVARSREVTDATALLMVSGFTRGFDEVAAVRAKYGQEPWFADVRGEFSGEVLGIPGWAPRWLVRKVAMRRDVGTSWEYEPLPVLERLEAPQLWVVAAEDREAPPVETLRRIRMLQANGRPIDLAVFPEADHGMLEYAEHDGERTLLRHPEGYFALLGDWIAQRPLLHRYGRATVEHPDMPALSAE
jgi:uncharacterized protein